MTIPNRPTPDAQWLSPPTWPVPPAGFVPEPGWTPDRSWGPPPAGWQFWQPATPPQQQDGGSAYGVAPGAAAPVAGAAIADQAWKKMKPAEKKAADPDRAKKETRTGLIGLLVLLLVVGGCTALVSGGDDDKLNDNASQSSPAPQPATEAPKASPAAATPFAAFEEQVRKDLGKVNREGVERIDAITFANGLAQVRFAADDNLTENLTKKGARIDTLDVIKAAKKLPELRELSVIVTFSLQNNLGEVSEQPVGNVVYSAPIVQRINVDTIDREKVWDVADVKSYTHPAFQFN